MPVQKAIFHKRLWIFAGTAMFISLAFSKPLLGVVLGMEVAYFQIEAHFPATND